MTRPAPWLPALTPTAMSQEQFLSQSHSHASTPTNYYYYPIWLTRRNSKHDCQHTLCVTCSLKWKAQCVTVLLWSSARDWFSFYFFLFSTLLVISTAPQHHTTDPWPSKMYSMKGPEVRMLEKECEIGHLEACQMKYWTHVSFQYFLSLRWDSIVLCEALLISPGFNVKVILRFLDPDYIPAF